MTYYGTCEVCGALVDSQAVDVRQRVPAFAVTGFEVPRAQGGTNHLRNRTRVGGKVWHEACLPDEKVNADQGALL